MDEQSINNIDMTEGPDARLGRVLPVMVQVYPGQGRI